MIGRSRVGELMERQAVHFQHTRYLNRISWQHQQPVGNLSKQCASLPKRDSGRGKVVRTHLYIETHKIQYQMIPSRPRLRPKMASYSQSFGRVGVYEKDSDKSKAQHCNRRILHINAHEERLPWWGRLHTPNQLGRVVVCQSNSIKSKKQRCHKQTFHANAHEANSPWWSSIVS